MENREKIILDLCQKAVKKWGKALQLVLAVEECSELQKEVCKILRGDYSFQRMEGLAREIADVRLMTTQLELMFSLTTKIEIETQVKLNRLERLIKL